MYTFESSALHNLWLNPRLYYNKQLNRGKGSDGIVLPLELACFINTVFGLLQLCLTPSRGGITTLSPPSPLFLRTDNFLSNPGIYSQEIAMIDG